MIVDGARVATDEVLLTVCPWWDGPRTRERVDRVLAADAQEVDGRMWIWAYHAPPDQSPTSWTGRRYYGDADLNAWIALHRPDLVLCGHVHESPFADGGGWSDRIGTTLGGQLGPRARPVVPDHIVIDTDERSARRFSSEGVRGALVRDGSVLRVRVALRAELRTGPRLVHEAAEHDVDHAETAVVVGVLVLEVGEIGRHALHPRREQPGQREREVGMLREHPVRVLDDRDRARLRRDHVGGRRDVEQQRQLADARAGFA